MRPIKKYNNEDKKELDKPFAFEDFTAALKSMKHDSAPGNDGLTAEFYICFWKNIGELIWQAMLYSHEKGVLYKSVRCGVICLIPKKNKDPLRIENWHPLCLLNVDSKIVTKMLANRLKTKISVIIWSTADRLCTGQIYRN